MKTQREILGENIVRLIERKGIDQRILAGEIGVSDVTISNWVRGVKYPRIDKIQALAEYFGVNHSDLVSDQSSTDILREAKNIYMVAPATVKVPVLGTISCGEPILAEENIKDYRYESKDMLPSGVTFYLEANGDSMEPTIPNGSLVLIRHQPDVESGEIAAVLLNDNEEATLKRVKKQGKNIFLYPENSNYSPIIIDKEHPAKIIGKAIEVKFKL